MKWPFSKKENKSSFSQVQLLEAKHHDYALNDWDQYAKEGYGVNPTIYRCISLNANNASSVAPIVKINGEVVDDHPVQKLLNKPNIDCGWKEFATESFTWIQLCGNLFTERLRMGKEITELWNWQPYNFSIPASSLNTYIPHAYVFDKDGRKYRQWDIDPNSGKSDMMHWGLFNPKKENAFMGMSPMQAAASSGDQLNAANKWRYDLFKNDCRPSGIVSSESSITDTDRKTLTKSLIEKARSKFLLLGGGLKWTQLGMTPKDADYLNGSKYSKQEICEVFGVPTQLIGIEGSMTFANMEQAVIHLYNQTILPLVDLYFSELTRWFKDDYEGIQICYNRDSIQALEPERKELLKIKLESNILTINQKLELIGMPTRDELDADTIFIDPNMLPIGMDVFSPDEIQAEQAAKSFMRMGMSREKAEYKAMKMFLGGDCQDPKD